MQINLVVVVTCLAEKEQAQHSEHQNGGGRYNISCRNAISFILFVVEQLNPSPSGLFTVTVNYLEFLSVFFTAQARSRRLLNSWSI